MRVLHIVPHLNQEAAGPSYSVPRLAVSMRDLLDSVEIGCLAGPKRQLDIKVNVYKEFSILGGVSIPASFFYNYSSLRCNFDVVHNHSLWSPLNMWPGFYPRKKSRFLVTSPRGTLSDWALANSALKKKVAWPIQRLILERSDLLHATSYEEYGEIRKLGLRAPVAVIPNGIDLPEMVENKNIKIGERKKLLFMSRIHPKKGIDLLLLAWEKIQVLYPDWDLVIAGTGHERHIKDVVSLAEKLRLDRVHFPGPLYGFDKENAYRSASLFILPTHSENFGMVVAEALSYGCPVIVSKGAPWSELEKNGCGWWIDNDVDTIKHTLVGAMNKSDDDLRSMGLRGRDWMGADYAWSAVARRMVDSYVWLRNGGELPPWIILD